LLLIGAGVLFLLNQTGVIDVDVVHLVTNFWPVAIIWFGLKGILIQRKLDYGWGGSYIWNLFLVLLGGYFLMRNLDIELLEGVNLWQFVAPVLLILFGINMLTKGPGSRHEEHKQAIKERHRQEKEEYKERKAQEKLAYKEQKHRDKMERKFPGQVYGEKSNTDHPDAPPQYDPGYTQKIEQDLDQVFHERVMKKLGDDPFPLLSETQKAYGTGANGQDPAVGGFTPPPPPPPPQHGKDWSHGWEGHKRRPVERSNFIGDIHLGHDYWELEPTNVSHFIGDTVIDLTKARIPYGETKLTVSSFIGDVKVFVPNDVQVEISVTASAFIGDMKVLDRHEGGLFRHMKYDTKHYNEAEKKISLTVSMFIGDVFIKRVG
jgi:lia operon protein LiaF